MKSLRQSRTAVSNGVKITVKRGSYDSAPKGYARVALVEKPRSHKRVVREKGIETLEIGAGKPSEMDLRRFITLCRSIVATAKANGLKKIAVQFDRTPQFFKNLQAYTPEHVTELAAANFEMANFEFTAFKTAPKEGWTRVEEILAFTPAPRLARAVEKGQEIGRAVNAARALSNTPGGDMTPTGLAKAAKDTVKGLPVKVTVLGVKEMQKLGMGALLGVAKGSTEAPTFTILEYKGGKGSPIVLAGKGVTFDSGGLNLKPESGIYEMHMDMSGAALVALGLHASGLMTRDDALARALLESGEASGDYVWRLPLWDEYEDRVKGAFADLSNVPSSGPGSRYGGAIDGGMFLWQFAKDLGSPWAHLDIAPRMTAAPGEELAKGAAGASVRLLLRFIETWPDTRGRVNG